MGSRLPWSEIQSLAEYRGRWVALDGCVYDTQSEQPLEGEVVDADDDLMELCARVRDGDSRHCAILFCGNTPHSQRPRAISTH
jgi:hypothetical protein